MKLSLTIILLASVIISYGQQPKINNNIKEVKTINIYGNNSKLIIAKLIVNQTLQTKLYLLSYSQTLNSLGQAITILNFGNNEKVPFFGGDLLIKFDKPVISVTDSIASLALGTSYGYGLDKMSYVHKVSQLNRAQDGSNFLLSFTITTTPGTKIIITKGIDGILKQ